MRLQQNQATTDWLVTDKWMNQIDPPLVGGLAIPLLHSFFRRWPDWLTDWLMHWLIVASAAPIHIIVVILLFRSSFKISCNSRFAHPADDTTFHCSHCRCAPDAHTCQRDDCELVCWSQSGGRGICCAFLKHVEEVCRESYNNHARDDNKTRSWTPMIMILMTIMMVSEHISHPSMNHHSILQLMGVRNISHTQIVSIPCSIQQTKSLCHRLLPHLTPMYRTSRFSLVCLPISISPNIDVYFDRLMFA